jgi:hypothetical protein
MARLASQMRRKGRMRMRRRRRRRRQSGTDAVDATAGLIVMPPTT